MPERIGQELIAPCGVDCLACSAFLRARTSCAGCRADGPKPKHCLTCARLACATERGVTWCFECDRYPCRRIRSLDASYVTRYDVPLVEQGRRALAEGIEEHLRRERERWACACGGVIDQHAGRCSECGSRGARP